MIMLNITNDLITSDRTPHTAKRLAGHQHLFQVSWMPLYPVGRNAAVAAMTIADEVGDGDQPADITLIDNLAAEIGMRGTRAIAQVMEPPDECELIGLTSPSRGVALRHGVHRDQSSTATPPAFKFGTRGEEPGLIVRVGAPSPPHCAYADGRGPRPWSRTCPNRRLLPQSRGRRPGVSGSRRGKD
jgi:hypothetical protein